MASGAEKKRVSLQFLSESFLGGYRSFEMEILFSIQNFSFNLERKRRGREKNWPPAKPVSVPFIA